MGHSPATLRAAAVVQAAESALVLVATVLSGIDTAAGRSYQLGSGVALTVIGAVSAAVLALLAVGLARARRWSRTPALLTQLFVGIVGIYLLQGHRFDWGVPMVVLAAAGFAALLAPPSLRALTGQERARPKPGGPGRPQP
jgi:Flp pilus assembly secretin CpaC